MPPPTAQHLHPFKVEWVTNPDGSPMFFKFDEGFGQFRRMRKAAKKDEIVLLKAYVNGNIGVELPMNRAALAAFDNLPECLNSLAEDAARRLLEGC